MRPVAKRVSVAPRSAYTLIVDIPFRDCQDLQHLLIHPNTLVATHSGVHILVANLNIVRLKWHEVQYVISGQYEPLADSFTLNCGYLGQVQRRPNSCIRYIP
jgi:hypothetical protein